MTGVYAYIRDRRGNVPWVSVARSPWKLEKENYNTLKNHGYQLEHHFGHGERYIHEAFFLHRIYALVNELYQKARAKFTSRRSYRPTSLLAS